MGVVDDGGAASLLLHRADVNLGSLARCSFIALYVASATGVVGQSCEFGHMPRGTIEALRHGIL